MAEIKGKLAICDRCRAEKFLKLVEEKEVEQDGGFSRYTKREYDPLPSSWTKNAAIGITAGFSSKLLCPDCSAYLDRLASEFWDTDKENE